MIPKKLEEKEFSHLTNAKKKKDEEQPKKINKIRNFIIKAKSIKANMIKRKTPDSSVNSSFLESKKSLTISDVEERNESLNLNSLREFNNMIESSENYNLENLSSRNILESKMEATLFCKQMLEDINKARANPKNYIIKIKELQEKIILKDNNLILEVNSNGKIYELFLLWGIQNFNESIDYINNINEELNPLELLSGIEIINPLSYDYESELNRSAICEFLKRKAEIKRFEVEKVKTIYSKWFDDDKHDAGLTNLISMIDGEENLLTCKLNFNSKLSHLNINTIKYGDNERITFLLYARQKSEIIK